MTKPDGSPADLSDHKGEVLLIVNVASKCGFTPQYEGLEGAAAEICRQGLLGARLPLQPVRRAGAGNADEISSFCKLTYDVSFPCIGKIDVNGDNAAPIYQHLKDEAPGLLRSKSIKWNFTKFLVDRSGKVVKRYPPQAKPEDLAHDIEALF